MVVEWRVEGRLVQMEVLTVIVRAKADEVCELSWHCCWSCPTLEMMLQVCTKKAVIPELLKHGGGNQKSSSWINTDGTTSKKLNGEHKACPT